LTITGLCAKLASIQTIALLSPYKVDTEKEIVVIARFKESEIKCRLNVIDLEDDGSLTIWIEGLNE
jgi:hypothetical protein